MSSHKDQLKSALHITLYVSLYSIAGFIVYWAGSLLGLSFPFQIALIALIVLTWPFAIAINYFRKKREQKNTSGQPDVSPSAKQNRNAPVAPVRSYDELTRSAEEAVQWLRSTRLAKAKSGDAVYQLPWFVIAGSPRSGKTSLLLSAGLDFQALPSQRRADQNLIRPTRDCEWRVTDWSVNIDTAGRYQTEGPDGDEWSALVETLKKYRKNRPLDGFLIAVNASRIFTLADAEIEQQAKTLRARLDEVIQRAENRFPIYLVFTNMDSIEGFDEFFKSLTAEERGQVWGATIPLEKSGNGHALFDTEFDRLYDSLMRRRLARLGSIASPEEQLRIFNFPIYFGEARKKLGLFISALFRPNPFSERPLLRGFYFTSSSTTNRKTHRKPQAVRAKGTTATLALPAPVVEEKANDPKVAGPGYFTENLFKDVLMRDKGLAESFLAGQKKDHRLRNILVGVACAVLALAAIGVITSYIANRILINDALERAQRVEEINRADIGKDIAKKTSVDAAVELNALEELRKTLAQLDDYERNSPPLYLRFGLYSGDEIAEPLRIIYFDAIDRRFFKPVVADLERDLSSFTSSDSQSKESSDNLGRYYDLLKAYLMLANPDRVEPAFLQNQLAAYWRKASASEDLEQISEEQLKFFATQAGHDDASHCKTDDKLVAESRRKLQAYPAVNRLFKQIISEIDSKVQPVTLDAILQGRGRGVLTGSYAVAGSFTIRGYRDHWEEAIESAMEEIGKDDWVMGSAAPATQDQSGDIGKLQSMYFRQYIDEWQKFLKGVSLRQFKSKADAVEALRSLSSSDSPMELLMTEVKRNTDLSAAPESSGIFGWITSLFSSDSKGEAGTTEVEKEFGPLFPFIASADKKARVPISEYRASLDQVLRALELKSDDQLAQAAKSILTGKDEVGLDKAEQDVSRMLEAFKTAAARDAAKVLGQPLGNLRAMLYGGGYEQIEKGWREQLYPKASALESGFPFKDSSSETPVTDLARFLNPANGQLTVFFNERLASSFEEGQGELKLKDAGAVKLSGGFVGYINNARRLRDALFAGGGQQPEVSYEIRLQPVSGADARIEVDGGSVETRGTSQQSAKFVWPARAGASGARIVVIRGGQQSEAAFPGEWGLFKMFAAGSPSATEGNQFQLTWRVGSSVVRATLQPSSATHPFDRKLFTRMRAPQGPNE